MLSIGPASNLGVIGNDLANYLCYTQEPLNDVDFTVCTATVKAALSPVPAIVPPATSKILSVGGIPRDGFVKERHDRVMRAIWATIITAMKRAREVIIIGYSLPGTDAAAIEALKCFAGSAAQPSRKKLMLVEPCPDIAERYRTVIGMRPHVIARDFRDFEPPELMN
jgi:hypothetical protein